EHLRRNEDDHQPERVLDRRPDLLVLLEEVPVVRGADPARRGEQVVVRERQVRAHHERVREEDRESDEPWAHQKEHETPAAPSGLALGPPAVPHHYGRERARNGRRGHGTWPDWPIAASICLSTFASPACRSRGFTWPACHLLMNVENSV